MKNPSKLAIFVAAAGSLSLLLSTSAFAEERHRDETRGQNHQQRETRSGNRDSGHQNNVQRSEPNRGTNEQSRSWNQGQTRSFDRGTTRSYDRSTTRSYDNNTRSYDRNNTTRSYDRNTTRSYDRNNSGYGRGYTSSYGSRSYGSSRDYRGSREAFRNGIPRSDGRVSMLGRISRYQHERGGYRVWVGGSLYPYWVPDVYFRTRGISIGLDLRLGGIFRDGAVYVDALGWPGDAYYTDPYYNDVYAGGSYYGGSVDAYESGSIRGVVDNVDLRSGMLYLRDDSTGRVITVDMRSLDPRNSRLDVGDLRRGDRVILDGNFVSNGVFNADRIASLDAY